MTATNTGFFRMEIIVKDGNGKPCEKTHYIAVRHITDIGYNQDGAMSVSVFDCYARFLVNEETKTRIEKELLGVSND